MLAVDAVSKTYMPPARLLRLVIRSASSTPVEALSNVSLTVKPGEIVGLIGANGAGKSTLMKIIASLLDATSGQVSIGGHAVGTGHIEPRQLLGLVLPDDRSHYWRLTGRQNLELFGALMGLDPAAATARADVLMQERGLADRDKRVFGYSSGMRAQLALGRALLHEPPLLVLDEPTRSLDPVAADAFCAELRRLADAGTAVLLSDHRLDEVERTCDRLVVLANGQMRWTGTVDELRIRGDARSEISAMLASP